MAIKELFYDQRPVALLNPRASQRIDPRFKFTRDGVATYVDREGVIRSAPIDQPRFNYNPATKAFQGFLVESEGINAINNSEFSSGTAGGTYTVGGVTATSFSGLFNNTGLRFENDPQGAVHYRAGCGASGTVVSFSCFVRMDGGGAPVFGNDTASSPANDFAIVIGGSIVSPTQYEIEDYGGGLYRVKAVQSVGGAPSNTGIVKYVTNSSTGVTTSGWQIENDSPSVTSYIRTTGSATTRAADLLSVEAPIPASGSLYVDAQAIATNVNDTLLSLKNASNQKINLAMEQRSELYNSLALTYSIKGTVKPTLPYPVPTTNRERNIITWGTNNYQYTSDSSRFAPSLSTTPGIPANLTQLSIGHDAVDPTKAFNGYINAVYLYNGEISPTVAEALVRGELDPVNADTYSPVGPTGSLALIINTQGASGSGDKVFALPAESALNDNDIVITWGDGTESGLDGAAAELGAPGLEHTYPSAGIYPVWVEGQLENLQFNNSASAPDLVKIEKWGTTANGNDVFLSPSTMANAFYGCSKLTSMPSSGLPDTSAVTDWYRAFRDCSSLTGTFPSFNFSAATGMSEAFYNCSSMVAFVAAGDQTQNVTNFSGAWYNCSSLTSFPLINTSSATNLVNAWLNCSGLTSFPLINTASCTNMSAAWQGCSALTSFPLLNTASCTNFTSTWLNCSALTAFPLINTSSGANFESTWQGCTGLTAFPLINTSSATNIARAWQGCSGLTSFPLIDTSSVTYALATWAGCSGLTSFPLLDTSSNANFSYAWISCAGLTSFPLLDTSSGQNFAAAWYGCSSLTAFPALNFEAAVGVPSDGPALFNGLTEAWFQCTSLTDFPAGRFNNTACTRFEGAWTSCALTAQSIENILVSIEAAGTSNGNLGIGGGTNAAKTTWSSAANTAYDALVARGWTITFNA